MNKQVFVWFLRAVLLTAPSSMVMAQEEPKFSWHGYIAQGLTQSIDSDFITEDNNITGELSEFGINGHYRLNSNLSVAGQVVYLDAGNRFEKGTRLDYLFVDWTIPDVAGWQAQVHIGRFKNTHWLYSVTRDVPQTRDTTVLPQSIYFDGFRDIALGSDGLQAKFKKYSTDSIWEVNWSYGRSPLNDAQRDFFLGDDAQGKIEQDFVHQASAFWQPATMAWRVGLSWLESDFGYTAAQEDNRLDGGANIRRFMFSMQYFSEKWQFSSELVRELQEYNGLFAPNYVDRFTGEGGFVQFRYLFNNRFSGLIGYDTYVNNSNDSNGEALEISSGGLVPSYFGYMDTVTVGARWDISPRWRLQAEHHWVDGAARVVSLLDPSIREHSQEHWRMWSVQLMYWF
ncbi:MAG: hypothetical protein ACJARF_002447 [Alteromonadaceae bacterium]|jgi:hypothetical protein